MSPHRLPSETRGLRCRAIHLFATAIWFAIPLAFAAGPASSPSARQADADAKYQRDRTLCLTGLTHQDRAACLREAAAARDEARRGALADEEGPTQYLENALRRCRSLPAEDRADCEARVRGEGTVRGSVEGGGIYRELVRPVPAR
jgi:hypothetical protein